MATQITFPVEITVTLDDTGSRFRVDNHIFATVTEALPIGKRVEGGGTMTKITLDHSKITTARSRPRSSDQMGKIENPANGCWLDGNLGQYQGFAIVNLTDDMLGTSYSADWPHGEDGKALGLYGETGNPWSALNGDDQVETMVEIMDECVAALNENTTGNGCWEWQDGDFGYYEVTPEDQEPF